MFFLQNLRRIELELFTWQILVVRVFDDYPTGPPLTKVKHNYLVPSRFNCSMRYNVIAFKWTKIKFI